MSNTDYDSYTDAALSGGATVNLGQLSELAEKQVAAEREVERCKEALERAVKDLKALSEDQVPSLMDQIGISEFKTSTGLQISVEETIRASIPKPRSGEAFQWLRAHDHGALIKRKVTVEFGKGEDDRARELYQYLITQNYAPEDDVNVHAQTLSAWVRENLRNGVDLPLDLFGVFRQRAAKIKV